VLLQPEYAVTEGPRRVERRIAKLETAVVDRDRALALRQDLAVEVDNAFVEKLGYGCHFDFPD